MAQRILKREQYPACLNVPKVRGVCVGDCIMGSVWKGNALAHTHLAGWPFKYRQWICFRYESALKNKETCLHELAHVLTGYGEYSHGKKWRKQLLALGGSLDPDYSIWRMWHIPSYHHKDCPRKQSRREKCNCV